MYANHFHHSAPPQLFHVIILNFFFFFFFFSLLWICVLPIPTGLCVFVLCVFSPTCSYLCVFSLVWTPPIAYDNVGVTSIAVTPGSVAQGNTDITATRFHIYIKLLKLIHATMMVAGQQVGIGLWWSNYSASDAAGNIGYCFQALTVIGACVCVSVCLWPRTNTDFALLFHGRHGASAPSPAMSCLADCLHLTQTVISAGSEVRLLLVAILIFVEIQVYLIIHLFIYLHLLHNSFDACSWIPPVFADNVALASVTSNKYHSALLQILIDDCILIVHTVHRAVNSSFLLGTTTVVYVATDTSKNTVFNFDLWHDFYCTRKFLLLCDRWVVPLLSRSKTRSLLWSAVQLLCQILYRFFFLL